MLVFKFAMVNADAIFIISARRRIKKEMELIDVGIVLKLDKLAVAVCTDAHLLTDIRISGLFATDQSLITEIFCCLFANCLNVDMYLRRSFHWLQPFDSRLIFGTLAAVTKLLFPCYCLTPD